MIVTILVYLCVALMLGNTYMVYRKGKTTFGREIAKTFFLGLLICILAAVRDDYATDASLISMSGTISSILSLLGFSLFIMAISSIFIKKIKYRKSIFIILNIIFIIKFVIMEIVRLIILL